MSGEDNQSMSVQIGAYVTTRLGTESMDDLLDRAIRDYPDKLATLIVVGRRASLCDTFPGEVPQECPLGMRPLTDVQS